MLRAGCVSWWFIGPFPKTLLEGTVWPSQDPPCQRSIFLPVQDLQYFFAGAVPSLEVENGKDSLALIHNFKTHKQSDIVYLACAGWSHLKHAGWNHEPAKLWNLRCQLLRASQLQPQKTWRTNHWYIKGFFDIWELFLNIDFWVTVSSEQWVALFWINAPLVTRQTLNYIQYDTTYIRIYI